MKRLFLSLAVLAIIFCGAASADYVIVKVDINQLFLGPKQPLIVQPKVDPSMLKGKGGNFGGGGFGGQGGFPPGTIDPTQGGGTIDPANPTDPNAKVAPKPVAVKLPPIYVQAYFETKKGGVPGQVGDVFEVELRGHELKKIYLAKRYTTHIPTGWHVAGEFGLRYDKAAAELKATPTEEKKQKLIGEAQWALQRGLLPEFKKCIDKLKEFDPKHITVTGVDKLAEQLKKVPVNDDPAAKMLMDELVQRDGYRFFDSEQGHYRMLTNIKSSNREADVKRKLAKLETLYTTFFNWHVLKGRPLTLPAYRLVVVLVDAPPSGPKEFLKKHEAYDHVPMVGTGFTARRDNVVFLSSHRMDETYLKLDLHNQEQWEKFGTSMMELTTNFLQVMQRVLAATAKVPEMQMDKQNDLLELHILSYCQKAMEDENEILTLSHEGVRQLIAATGVLPRDVQTAEWARSGLASFFEVPPHSFFPSTGGANWNHLVRFKALVHDKKLERKDAKDILLNIVSDTYFRDAYALNKASLKSKETKEQLGPKAQQDLDLARATAWSLVHFLAHTKDKQFARFLQDVNNLPRDLNYDGRVVRDCFLRSFDLINVSPDKPGQATIKNDVLDSLAQEWFRYTDRAVALDSSNYEQYAIDQLVTPTKTQPAGKATPGGKGGFPQGSGAQQGGGAVPPPGIGGQQGGGVVPPPGVGGQGGSGGQGGVIPPDKKGGGRE